MGGDGYWWTRVRVYCWRQELSIDKRFWSVVQMLSAAVASPISIVQDNVHDAHLRMGNLLPRHCYSNGIRVLCPLHKLYCCRQDISIDSVDSLSPLTMSIDNPFFWATAAAAMLSFISIVQGLLTSTPSVSRWYPSIAQNIEINCCRQYPLIDSVASLLWSTIAIAKHFFRCHCSSNSLK